MRILITNDDGAETEGLRRLCESLREVGELVVVVPDRQRSGASHSITALEPLRLKKTLLLDGLSAHTTNGTPADCVALAVSLLGEGGFDLVVSGINHGWNLGPDVFHSGTVMAAAEASLLGLPALAFSAGGGEPTRFETAAWFARAIVQVVMQKGLPKGTFLNVNIPDLPRHKIESVMITRLNLSVFNEPFERRSDPHGASYYWRGGPVRLRISSDSCRSQNDQAGTDTLAVHQGFVSVTPLRLDPTDTDSLEILQSWRLETSADPNEEGDNRE